MAELEFKRVRESGLPELERLLSAYNPNAVIQGRYYMAVEDGKIKGFVGVLWRGWYLTELRHLYVKPEFRRSGVGRFLVGNALGKVETPLVCCTVSARNEASVAVFRSLNFLPVRRFHSESTGNEVILHIRQTQNEAYER
jgi:ribosomal protein S18 acetylase RimI-like enzyme